MRLPLFVLAIPQSQLSSPTVLIGKGSWRLDTNHTNSVIELRSKSFESFPISNGQEIKVDEMSEVYAHVCSAGKERTLTIFLDRIPEIRNGTGSGN